jgi:hypothetical protein
LYRRIGSRIWEILRLLRREVGKEGGRERKSGEEGYL